ncbi:MAG: serine/threonine protein kinase [Deltaproteobacteria bacterium]|nr:serine/threonine protein kinase [Deltaproteobacteria bacterium]
MPGPHIAHRPKPAARAVRRPDPLVGALLGGSYRIEAPLARGGMGALYRGTHLRLQRPVAIKVLAAAFAGSDTARRRFRREARALARLHSEHVVEVLDVLDAPDGRPVLVTELLEGEDLSQRIERRGPLPTAEVLAIAVQLARALCDAHAAGVVHRDLKPSNVFLDGESGSVRVKLLDFGVARVDDDAAITRTGVALGTPLYMAPEQVRKASAADARSDVYGAGAVLYHALTGHAPYPGGNATEALARVLDGPPPAPSRRQAGIPFAVEELVLRAMAREPEARFASARALGERAQHLLTQLAPSTRPITKGSRFRDAALFLGGSSLAAAGLAAQTEVLDTPVAPFAAVGAALTAVGILRRWPALSEHLAMGTALGFITFAAASLLGRLGFFGELAPFALGAVTMVTGAFLAATHGRPQRRSKRAPESPVSPSAIGSSTTLPSDSASRPAIQREDRSASHSLSSVATPGSGRSPIDPPSSSSNRNAPAVSRKRPSARRMMTGSASAGY